MFDFEELISWADKHGLDEQVFPRDKRQLAALEELMLIDCQLTELPESIALLSQLKKLVTTQRK